MRSPRNQATALLLGGSGIAAILTWTLQAAVGRILGPRDFAAFMIVWGLVFFVLAVLQGIQQEVVRAVASLPEDVPPAMPRSLTARAATLAVVALAVVALVLGVVLNRALPRVDTALIAAPLTVTIPVLVVHQVFNGLLAGRHLWGYYGLSLVLEALTRCLVVVAAVALGFSLAGQTTALVIGGLGWSLLLIAPRVRAALRVARHLDPRSIAANASQTLVATGSSALLINAFPVLLQLSGGQAPTAEVGVVIAAVVLTRAPLMMPLYALQGLVISTFTRNPAGVLGTLVRLGGTVSVVSSLGAVLAWLIGPWAMRLVFGDAFVVSGGLLAALIIAAGLMAMMTLAGWAALSQRRLRAYAWSWASTPVAAVLVLLVPASVTVRTGASLVVAPAVGLVVLGVWSIRAGRGGYQRQSTQVSEPG